MTNDYWHKFVGRREWGIHDHNPDHECQRCGIRQGEHPVGPNGTVLTVQEMDRALYREPTSYMDHVAGFNINRYDLDAVHALLTRLACPVVCRGYLDGGENWHEVCLNTADEAMRVLGMHPPERETPATIRSSE